MKEICTDESKTYSIVIQDVNAKEPTEKIELFVENYDKGMAIIDCLEKNIYCI